MAEDAQKRSSRACDACKLKRIRCDDVVFANTSQQSCKGCRELGQYCSYEAPVRKRGPAVGSKRKRQPGSSADAVPDLQTSSTPPLRDHSLSDATVHVNPELSHASSSQVPSPDSAYPPSRLESRISSNRDAPLLGLPRPMVDELLIVYFTHVHNVWPLIYKPAFTPYNVSPLLLCSMLAISACVSSPSAASGYDARKLYQMAESALHRSRAENRIDVVQALILLSLTQTGCGDKGAAFIYASRAVGMILNMGLNLAGKYDVSSVDGQTRSRVLWNCYVLDKSLSEETGRSYLLPYRRCSTPFPSLDEVDELEVWPPLSTSSAPLPPCVRRLTPRRGHVISCFIWTCRLAMVVEDILDLDSASLPGSNEWDRQFRESSMAKRGDHGEETEAARIEEQLNRWREMLPAHLAPNDRLSPLPHHVIGLAWHATATIMLHSRYVVRISRASMLPSVQSDWATHSHKICSNAARQTVQMLRSLDKFGLLEQISSDAIHILSLAALFDAFDMTNPDVEVAARAKEDFNQCCTWLRHFSSMWPAASAHKLFFEAVYQGGLKLVDPEAGNEDMASPLRHTASLLSPSLTGGLQAVRRHLSVSQPSDTHPAVGTVDPPLAGASGMLQIPHYFWNHLSTAATLNGNGLDNHNHNPTFDDQTMGWDTMFNFEGSAVDTGVNDPGSWEFQSLNQTGGDDVALYPPPAAPWSVPVAAESSHTSAPLYHHQAPQEMRSEQAAISTALMNLMANMTKTNPHQQ